MKKKIKNGLKSVGLCLTLAVLLTACGAPQGADGLAAGIEADQLNSKAVAARGQAQAAGDRGDLMPTIPGASVGDSGPSSGGTSSGGNSGGSTGSGIAHVDMNGTYLYQSKSLTFTLTVNLGFEDAKPLDRPSGDGIYTSHLTSGDDSISGGPTQVSAPYIPRSIVVTADCTAAGHARDYEVSSNATVGLGNLVYDSDFVAPAIGNCDKTMHAVALILKTKSYRVSKAGLQLNFAKVGVASKTGPLVLKRLK